MKGGVHLDFDVDAPGQEEAVVSAKLWVMVVFVVVVVVVIDFIVVDIVDVDVIGVINDVVGH